MKRMWLVLFMSIVAAVSLEAQGPKRISALMETSYIWPDSLRGEFDNITSIAVSSNGRIFAATDTRYLLVSDDTGRTWKVRDRKNGLVADFGTVIAILILNDGSVLATTENGIFRSEDDGESWINVKSTEYVDRDNGEKILTAYNNALLQASDGTIYAASYGVIRSTDSGKTWEAAVPWNAVYPYVRRMTQTPSGTIILGTASGSDSSTGIVRSTDNGKSWAPSNSGLSYKNIEGGLAAYPKNTTSQTVYASTYLGGVYSSDNDGATWKKEKTPHYMGGAALVTSTLEVFIGIGANSPNSGLYRLNEGEWEFVCLERQAILSFAELSPTKLLVGTWDGLYLLTFDNMTDVENNNQSSMITDYHLRQNYPNPFNPSTTIEFSLPKRSHVNLAVYNALGQEVANLIAEERSEGTHRVTWNASGHPSGIYFYRLETGVFTETKRMLLIK